MREPEEIIINGKTLKEILDNHKHWLNEDCDGWENMKANLSYANLRYANLRYANLRYADFSYANLGHADLSYANLGHADLSYAKDLYHPYACPDFGMFIGWKKAHGNIVCLEIPENAKRCSATGRKCRCDKAKVLGIYDYERNLLDVQEVCSDRDESFIYKVGEIVSVDNFNENRWEECTSGIHFFINFQEAVDYNS